MSKRRKIDTILLAVTLFATSGAVLAYNIYSSDGGSITVSLSELVAQEPTASAALMHPCAQANLESGSTVYASTEPEPVPGVGAVLPPIVTPPTE